MSSSPGDSTFFPDPHDSSESGLINQAYEILRDVDIRPTTFVSSKASSNTRPHESSASIARPPAPTSSSQALPSKPFFQQQNRRRTHQESMGNEEPELPAHKYPRTQPPAPTGIHPPIIPRPKKTVPLAPSNAYFFKNGLFIRYIIQGDNLNMRVTCAQEKCAWDQVYPCKYEGTGNFTRYYQSVHSGIPCLEKDERVKKVVKEGAKDFFKPRQNPQNLQVRDKKFKTLLLNFFIKNNLSFRVVDQ
jgi:hypothetical protein